MQPINYSIIPLTQAGLLRFGMSQAEVRQLLGEPFQSVKKTPFDSLPTDDYRQYSLHVHYGDGFRVNGISFWPGANVSLYEHAIIKQPLSQVLKWLIPLDPSLKVDLENEQIFSALLGLSIFAPDADDDPDAKIESVYVFKKWEEPETI